MMNKLLLSRLSEQDYLLGELTSELRHEYVDGEVFAMAEAGEAHNLIAGNVFAKLREFVRGGPCRVFISDMKLHVNTWKAYYYPDVMVTCDPADNQSHFKEQPVLVVEVLSPATNDHDKDAIPDDETCHDRSLTPVPPLPMGEGYGSSLREFHVNRTDRREKMLAYRTLSSLREYVLIATDRRQVECYRRDEQEEWQLAVSNDGLSCSLDGIEYHLTLDEIYEDVRLDASLVRL
jgi:Uma2 family endonuclease